MSEKKLAQSVEELIKGIIICLNNDLILPSLILIYSGIDTVGWLSSSNPKEKVQDSFIRWSDRYIDPENKFNCSSLDLYSARCGLLHRLNPDSKISEKGDAKIIGYYTNEETNEMEEAIKKYNKTDKYVAIKLENFFEAFREGMFRFLSEVYDDPVLYSVVTKKADRSFMMIKGPFDNYEIVIN